MAAACTDRLATEGLVERSRSLHRIAATGLPLFDGHHDVRVIGVAPHDVRAA
jgi:hypothetical protein